MEQELQTLILNDCHTHSTPSGCPQVRQRLPNTAKPMDLFQRTRNQNSTQNVRDVLNAQDLYPQVRSV